MVSVVVASQKGIFSLNILAIVPSSTKLHNFANFMIIKVGNTFTSALRFKREKVMETESVKTRIR